MLTTRFNAEEWLSANLHRAFPLSDLSSGQSVVPSALLADALFLVSGFQEDQCFLHLSKILTTNTSIVFYISGRLGPERVSDLAIATFSKDDRIGTSTETSHQVGSGVLYSKLVIGDITIAGMLPGERYIEEAQGAFSPCCIRALPSDFCNGIIVNGQRTRNIVTFEPGAGIELDLVNISGRIKLSVSSSDGTSATMDSYTGIFTGEMALDVTDDLLSSADDSTGFIECAISDTQINSSGEVTAHLVLANKFNTAVTGRVVADTGATLIPAAGTVWEIQDCELSEVVAGSIIRISAKDYTPPIANEYIQTDDELLARAIEKFGAPVRSINGVYPDSAGVITIVGDSISTSADASNNDKDIFNIEVSAVNTSAGAVTITLSKPIQCDVDSIVTTLMQNVSELNKRGTALANHITALDTANSNLAARLTGLV